MYIKIIFVSWDSAGHARFDPVGAETYGLIFAVKRFC